MYELYLLLLVYLSKQWLLEKQQSYIFEEFVKSYHSNVINFNIFLILINIMGLFNLIKKYPTTTLILLIIAILFSVFDIFIGIVFIIIISVILIYFNIKYLKQWSEKRFKRVYASLPEVYEEKPKEEKPKEEKPKEEKPIKSITDLLVG